MDSHNFLMHILMLLYVLLCFVSVCSYIICIKNDGCAYTSNIILSDKYAIFHNPSLIVACMCDDPCRISLHECLLIMKFFQSDFDHCTVTCTPMKKCA